MTSTDRAWMATAIEVSRHCPPARGAYSVGAVIVSAEGVELARGYSRESEPHIHAEEAALVKLPDGDPRLASATLYSTLEPCSQRHSQRPTCTELVLKAGIPRVVIAWREPALFVDNCVGVETLRAAGVEVVELTELGEQARAVNSHLLS